MRGFLVLCLIAVATAAQLPGYNYQGPGGSAGSVGAGSSPVGHFGHGGGGEAAAVWNKQYFIHSAPEDSGLDGSSSENSQVSLNRNLRVVFIKAPENKGLENAALQLAKSASEDKTAIYVLNKQTDLSELQQKLSQIQDINANKPEVHFVKYKTPEEAEHAQHTIQSQYDALQGPTQISNEGVAPVQNFIGSAGHGGHGGSFGGNGGHGGSFGGNGGGFGGFGSASGVRGQALGPSSNYLPPQQPQQKYIPPAQTYLPPGFRF